MSGSCCGGASKAEAAKAAVKAAVSSAPLPIEATAEQLAAKSNKSECCNDTSTKSEKHSCGC